MESALYHGVLKILSFVCLIGTTTLYNRVLTPHPMSRKGVIRFVFRFQLQLQLQRNVGIKGKTQFPSKRNYQRLIDEMVMKNAAEAEHKRGWKNHIQVYPRDRDLIP